MERNYMKSVILVGGPMDGQQITLEQDCVFRVPVRNQSVTYIEYTKHTFAGTVKPYFVYALNGMSCDEIFERLIANYKP